MVKGSFEFGCAYSGGGNATEFFKPDCNNCMCIKSVPKSCPATSTSTLPDDDNNCKCSLTTVCYQGDAEFAGCDRIGESKRAHTILLPQYNVTDRFRQDCEDCHCKPVAYAFNTAGKAMCNANNAQCLSSSSNYVGTKCEDSEYERCCSEDQNSCSQKCCNTTPSWLIITIVMCVVVLVIVPAALVLRYLHHKYPAPQVAPAPQRMSLDNLSNRLSHSNMDGFNSRPSSASFSMGRPGSGVSRVSAARRGSAGSNGMGGQLISIEQQQFAMGPNPLGVRRASLDDPSTLPPVRGVYGGATSDVPFPVAGPRESFEAGYHAALADVDTEMSRPASATSRPASASSRMFRGLLS